MFKKAKVVMLATNKKATVNSIVHRNSDNRLAMVNVLTVDDPNKHLHTTQHLYIISDEEIKEDDWFIANQAPRKCIRVETKNTSCPYITLQDGKEVGHFHTWHNVIIASTNTELNLPQLSHSFITKFIEEYNKGNVITEVMVEYEEYMTDGWIPTYNNPDNNNLEQSAELDIRIKVNPKDNTITIKKIKDSWTREEMYLNMQYYYEYIHMNDYVTPQDWLEKYKHF